MIASTVMLTTATIAGLFVAAASAQPCDSSPLLIRNANVWTAQGIVEHRDVFIRDGRVATIESTRARRQSTLRTIDATGHTLLPGLVDAHLHFSIPGGLPPGALPRADTADITARQLVRSGVTAGRLHLASLDDAVRLKARSADACAAVPRLQVGGPGLSGAADRDYPAFQGAKTREDGIAKIERFKAAGVDWVAIHEADRFAPDVLEAIGQAARRTGIRVMAAGSTGPEILAALRIKPDTLDYMDRTADPLYAAPAIEAIRAQSGLTLVPTPGVPYRTGKYLADPKSIEQPENFAFLDPADRAFVLANARKDLAGPEAARAQRLLTTLPAKFQQLRQLGVAMALGSDAGSTLHFQAGAIWWELEAWRLFGASHRDALRAATEQAARVLRADDIGRVAVGARGDFVLYRGNVESGHFDLARVLAVGKGGVVYVSQGRWIGPGGR